MSAAAEDGPDHESVLHLLRRHTGIDFTLYKSSTVNRRIHRRMLINQITSVEGYERFLRENAAELDALHADMLITLTGFFRNPEAFDALMHSVFPKLVQRGRERPVRVWVPGCSTGQEAYSLVMAFLEAMEDVPHPPRLQVFATDLSQRGVEAGRTGRYAKTMMEGLTPERTRRFFEEDGSGSLRLRKVVRDKVVFAQHDLLRAPPFSRLDLVSCRNLLIYLRPGAQRRVFSLFAHALGPGGFLFLGSSESPGSPASTFEALDAKNRIYVRTDRDAGTLPRADEPRRKVAGAATSPGSRATAPETHSELGIQRAADRAALGRYAPRGVLVDSDLQVVEFRGDTRPWVRPPVGKATFDVRRLVHEALLTPLRSALGEAKRTKAAVRREVPRVVHEGREHVVLLEVIPLRHAAKDYFLVSLAKSTSPPGRSPAARDGGGRGGSRAVKGPRVAPGTGKSERALHRRIADLEGDLAEAQDDMRSLQEQHDAVVEEMNSANEEATSANEELQSINEEMEAAKEELESVNEELTTVNDELAKQNVAFNRTTADLLNTERVAALEIVILGSDATVRRFTPSAAAHFSLKESDLGRPLHACINLPGALHGSLPEAMAARGERTFEFQDSTGRWYSARVAPYVGPNGETEGAVLSFLDIHARKERDEVVRVAREYAEAIVRTVRDGLLILDADMTVHDANEAFYAVFKTTEAETLGKSVFEVFRGQWNTPILHNRLDDMVARNSSFEGLETSHDVAGHRRTFLVGGRVLREPGAGAGRILVSFRDITEAMQFQVWERAEGGLYRRLFETSRDGFLLAKADTGAVREVNEAMLVMLGSTPDGVRPTTLSELPLSTDLGPTEIDLDELRQKGSVHIESCMLTSRTGARRNVEVRARIHEDVLAPLVVVNVREREGKR